jgi:hypothetical protein
MMMNAIVLAAALSSASAPDLVHRRDDDSEVRLQTRPCVHARVLAQIPQAARSQFHHGVSVRGGMLFPLCWTRSGASIYIIDDEGDVVRAPVDDFEAETGL